MRLVLVAVAPLVILAVACSTSVEPGLPPGAEHGGATPQESHQTQWDALGVDDYTIVYEIHNRNGMGGSPDDGRFAVTVQDGVVTDCTLEDGWLGKSGPCDLPVPDPIDRIFAMLGGFDPQFARVVYHPEWPFPKRIDYDVPDVADEEYTIRVLDFESPAGS